jgi:hypothetical protein
MVKYFSEKVSPAVHDAAAKKEAFASWKEQFIHHRYSSFFFFFFYGVKLPLFL